MVTKQKCECCKKESFELIIQQFDEGINLKVCVDCKNAFDEEAADDFLLKAREDGIEW
jgi:hypothetical protein